MKVLVAVARKMLIAVWHVLHDNTIYIDFTTNTKGNIRDYASINELICLSNMESLNAVFIDQGLPQGERLLKLNHIAILQMKVLENDGNKQLSKQNK